MSRMLVAALAMLAGVVVLVGAGGAGGHNGISLTGAGTPVVDGVISPGEWDGASTVSFMATVAGGPSVPGTLRVMNDAANLYIAVRVGQPMLGSIAFRFDNNHDGSGVEQGDDNLAVGFQASPPGTNKLSDGTFSSLPPCPTGFMCGFRDTDIGGTTDGFGAYQVLGNEVDYELSHPLDSADDAHDFSLHEASVVGFLFQVITFNASGTSSITQPFGSTVPSDVLIGPPPATVPESPAGVEAFADDASATVSWAPPASDGGSAITGYVVTPYADGVEQTPIEVGLEMSTTVTELANGTTYTFAVKARNTVGLGPPALSNPVTPAVQVRPLPEPPPASSRPVVPPVPSQGGVRRPPPGQ